MIRDAIRTVRVLIGFNSKSVSGFGKVRAMVESRLRRACVGILSSIVPLLGAPCAQAATEVAAGYAHSCAVLTGGNVSCWGYGGWGSLGYANGLSVGDDETPLSVGQVAVGAAVMHIALGFDHSCAVTQSGQVRCWGVGSEGQLGYGNESSIGDNETPASAGSVSLGASALKVAAGEGFSCALLSNGEVKCWGLGAYGQLGTATVESIGDNELPSSAASVGLGAAAVDLVAGAYHACALLSTQQVRCWGLNISGELGTGNLESIGDDELPSSIPTLDVGGSVVQMAAGLTHTCVRLSSGAVRCFGDNAYGQLGYGHTNSIGDDEVPSAVGVVNLGAPAVQIAAGDLHTCALLNTGAVRCWGDASEGALGYGNLVDVGDDEVPASVSAVNIGGSVAGLALGGAHSCALLTNGHVRCWGQGDYGQLGYASTASVGDNETPASVGDVLLETVTQGVPLPGARAPLVVLLLGLGAAALTFSRVRRA